MSEKRQTLEGDVYTQFHEFWLAYNKCDSQKNKAAGTWLAINPDEELFQEILYAACEGAKTQEKNTGLRQTRLASHQRLKGQRWENWIELRAQVAQPDLVVVDWDSAGETFDLTWKMDESFDDSKQRVITAFCSRPATAQ